MAEDPNTFMLFVRLGLSFGMVLGLVGAVTWFLRRRGLLRPVGGTGAGGRLEVLDRKSLGKSSSLVVARVGGKALLLGVTGERIELLSDEPGLDAAWRADGVATATTTEVPRATRTDGPADAADAVEMAGAAPARTAIAPRTRPVHTTPTTGGARRTGHPVAAPAAGRTRMSFIEALQELTVRRS